MRWARWMAAAACVIAAGAAATLADDAPPAPEDTAFAYAPSLTIEGGNAQLEAAVRSASLLFTFAAEPPDSIGVLFTRARADRARIVRALNALGYFAPAVTIDIDGGPIDDPVREDALAEKPPVGSVGVAVAVVPGPLFVFAAPKIEASPGSAAEPLAALAPTVTGFAAGEPARSALVVAANERIVAALREEGFPFAAITGREAIADHNTGTLEVTFRVAAGAKAAFGDVAVKGNERADAEYLKSLAPFAPGDPYKAAILEDYKDELDRLAIFGSVATEEGTGLDADGRLPVTVAVSERPLRAVGVSASWSTLEGLALGGYWQHRNLWERAEQLRIEAQAARLLSNGADDYEYGLRAALTFPATPTRRDDLIVSAAATRERPDAFERDAVFTELRVRRRFDKTLRAEAAIGFAQARETDVLGTRDRTTVELPLSLVYDTRDNILDPTSGIRASANLEPVFNLTRGAGLTARFDAAASTYFALDETTVLAGRLAFGVSAAPDVTDLPVDLRFFAGGGGSVRGYEYQALSPRDAINQIIGGLSLIEGSVEVRSWLWDDIGLAAFVDAGAASNENAPGFEDIGVGVGLGVRYRTPVGPLRLDVALPLDPPAGDAEYGVYVALGQAF